MLNYAVTMIKENLKNVRDSITQAANKAKRSPKEIKLVCVTKEANIEQVREAIACGVTDLGENRLRDAVEKYAALRGTMDEGRRTTKWHFIGHLQTNKVKKVVEIFDLIHSVDSFHLAEEISKQAAKINKSQDILIQVNTSGEKSKFGVAITDLNSVFSQLIKLAHINILGLMAMAPLADDPEQARPCFRKLKELSEELDGFLPITDRQSPITELSMGMTQDYQVAIEEGATIVRIGSAIFK